MKGYKRVAAWMGTYPSQGMVSRFSALNIQNLLYMQAEIFTLQSDLTELEEADAASPYPLRQKFATDWFELSSSKDNGSDEQWKLVLLIREKLQVYNEGVVRYANLASLDDPREQDLRDLQEWLRRPSMGSVYLIGPGRHVWRDGKDLVALRPREPENHFSSWLSETLTPLYHRAFGKHFREQDPEVANLTTNSVWYSDTTIFKIASFLGIIMASLLPVSAIVVLYFVNAMGSRLGLVGAFTAIFSVCLWAMTDGRLIEVFSATSAFAAVQVVFISTNITSVG